MREILLVNWTATPHRIVSPLQTEVLGDPNVRLIPKGERFQFERKGYFICDQPLFNQGPATMFEIPDGSKQSPVQAAWKAKEQATKAPAKK